MAQHAVHNNVPGALTVSSRAAPCKPQDTQGTRKTKYGHRGPDKTYQTEDLVIVTYVSDANRCVLFAFKYTSCSHTPVFRLRAHVVKIHGPCTTIRYAHNAGIDRLVHV